MSLILYVEDEILMQIDGEAVLRAAGYDVVTASNGAEGCAALRRLGLDVSALITDINLAGAPGGWQVASLARRIDPDLPVIYVTASEGGAFAANGVPEGILVPKPFDWAKVLRLLASLLRPPALPPTWAGRGGARGAIPQSA